MLVQWVVLGLYAGGLSIGLGEEKVTHVHLWTLHKSIQPRSSAVNTTLPACAAERRAAAPLLLSTGPSGHVALRSFQMFLASCDTVHGMWRYGPLGRENGYRGVYNETMESDVCCAVYR